MHLKDKFRLLGVTKIYFNTLVTLSVFLLTPSARVSAVSHSETIGTGCRSVSLLPLTVSFTEFKDEVFVYSLLSLFPHLTSGSSSQIHLNGPKIECSGNAAGLGPKI